VKKFPSNRDLNVEVRRMLEAVMVRFLHSDADGGHFDSASSPFTPTSSFSDKNEENFLSSVFDNLDQEVRRQVVESELAFVEAQQPPACSVPDDVLVRKCCLLFISLKKFPGAANARGTALFRLLNPVKFNQSGLVAPGVEKALHVFRRALGTLSCPSSSRFFSSSFPNGMCFCRTEICFQQQMFLSRKAKFSHKTEVFPETKVSHKSI
jgi:hypothetical protein